MNYNVFWFRRDLRLTDNLALLFALRSGHHVLPIFIFDTQILEDLSNKQDLRVQFIHHTLKKMDEELRKVGSSMLIFKGNPVDIWSQIIRQYKIETVFCTHDYEPYARERDKKIKHFLASKGVELSSFKDQVIFEKDEIVKPDGSPYTVYTPYSKRWLSKVRQNPICFSEGLLHNFAKLQGIRFPDIEEIGFKTCPFSFPKPEYAIQSLLHYADRRDFPALDATSRLGIHLRFGTISIRELVNQAAVSSPVFLNELIWREFYTMILWYFPHVVTKSFKPAYDNIEWINDMEDFERWKTGTTGYPMVDAGMRQLNQTGFMHNRLRMITASFLCKHLLIDWRWGEAYFAEKLLDFELASNNGGWQWAAGTGVDAAPYFRIFSPDAQTKRFDAKLEFIKKWVPEFQAITYPKPVIEHDFARKRVLAVYQKALKA